MQTHLDPLKNDESTTKVRFDSANAAKDVCSDLHTECRLNSVDVDDNENSLGDLNLAECQPNENEVFKTAFSPKHMYATKDIERAKVFIADEVRTYVKYHKTAKQNGCNDKCETDFEYLVNSMSEGNGCRLASVCHNHENDSQRFNPMRFVIQCKCF